MTIGAARMLLQLLTETIPSSSIHPFTQVPVIEVKRRIFSVYSVLFTTWTNRQYFYPKPLLPGYKSLITNQITLNTRTFSNT